jgi:hypothetical protein
MVALGNFQRFYNSQNSQNNQMITYDTFTDTGSLALSRPNTTKIYEAFNLKGFSWRKSYIQSIFQKAYANRNKADYFVFLLQEEIYLPSQSSGWQHIPNDYKKDKTYTIEGSTIHTDRGEVHYLNDLLRAWHKFIYNLKDSKGNIMKKKVAIIGCPRGYYPVPKTIFEQLYHTDNLKYIAKEYDMVYLYRYPSTGNSLKTGYRAKELINYWRNSLKFKGKINYVVDTYFGGTVGSTDYNTILNDFTDASNSGAHVISAYPFSYIKDQSTYNKGAPRLIQLYNDYNKNKQNGW